MNVYPPKYNYDLKYKTALYSFRDRLFMQAVDVLERARLPEEWVEAWLQLEIDNAAAAVTGDCTHNTP